MSPSCRPTQQGPSRSATAHRPAWGKQSALGPRAAPTVLRSSPSRQPLWGHMCSQSPHRLHCGKETQPQVLPRPSRPVPVTTALSAGAAPHESKGGPWEERPRTQTVPHTVSVSTPQLPLGSAPHDSCTWPPPQDNACSRSLPRAASPLLQLGLRLLSSPCPPPSAGLRTPRAGHLCPVMPTLPAVTALAASFPGSLGTGPLLDLMWP